MSNAADTGARAKAYVAAVQAALSDLEPRHRQALTAGLAEHLQELDDAGAPLLDQQPTPQQYAAELRSMAPEAEHGDAMRQTATLRWRRWVISAVVVALTLAAGTLVLREVASRTPSFSPSPTPATPTNTIIVPNLIGQPAGKARARLASVGLHVGQVHTRHETPMPAGTVVAMSPAIGSAVASGAGIDLVIAR